MPVSYAKEQQYLPVIAAASKKYGVPIPLIMGHIRQESNYDPKAYRAEPQINDASYGMMQLLLRTAKGLDPNATAAKLYDPAYNIDLGTKLIKQNLQKYSYNVLDAIAAYNAGVPRKNEKGQYVNSKGVTNVEYYVRQVEKFMHQYQDWAAKGLKTLQFKWWDVVIGIGFVGLIIWMLMRPREDTESDEDEEVSYAEGDYA